MINIDSIFKLTPYSVARTNSRYPTFRLRKEMPILFRSVEDAERDMLAYNGIFPYSFALSEMPVGMQFFTGESFSERIYLPDGQLWGKRLYSNVKPLDIPPQYWEIEFDNYIYGR